MGPHDAKPESLRKLSLTQEAPQIARTYYKIFGGTFFIILFGIAYLRLAKELQPGYVVTVEPGIYFIPALIDKWKDEKKFTQFINYEKVEDYRDFGGVRIEDNLLVTEDRHRVIGKTIPKTPEEVEEITATE